VVIVLADRETNLPVSCTSASAVHGNASGAFLVDPVGQVLERPGDPDDVVDCRRNVDEADRPVVVAPPLRVVQVGVVGGTGVDADGQHDADRTDEVAGVLVDVNRCPQGDDCRQGERRDEQAEDDVAGHDSPFLRCGRTST